MNEENSLGGISYQKAVRTLFFSSIVVENGIPQNSLAELGQAEEGQAWMAARLSYEGIVDSAI